MRSWFVDGGLCWLLITALIQHFGRFFFPREPVLLSVKSLCSCLAAVGSWKLFTLTATHGDELLMSCMFNLSKDGSVKMANVVLLVFMCQIISGPCTTVRGLISCDEMIISPDYTPHHFTLSRSWSQRQFESCAAMED